MQSENQDPLLFENGVQAGFPSPTDEDVGNQLNLLELLVPRPHATFYVRVKGDSMIGAGIFSDDLLIVDRSINPKDQDVVVAVVNKEFTVKRLVFENQKPKLVAQNANYPTLHFNEEDELEIWGVVTFVIHRP